MEHYKNLSGDSGVSAFAIGSEFITVRFKQGAYKEYTYTYASAGSAAVEIMKKLAVAGRGLNSYINTNVKHAYERKAA